MNGGYLMVSKTDTDLYAKLVKGLTIGKPILWYESPTECYYIDTISGGEVTSEIVDDEEVFTYHDIILTKGGKTITIEADGDITESGEIQTHLYVVTFNGGDYRVSMFAKKKLNDYEVGDMTSLTSTDIEYFKSLKDVLYDNANTPVGTLYSADSNGIAFSYMTGIYDKVLYLNIESYEYEINLDNPENQTTGDSLSIKFTQLI